MLSEIREDDAVLIDKISQLEKRLRKTSQTKYADTALVVPSYSIKSRHSSSRQRRE